MGLAFVTMMEFNIFIEMCVFKREREKQNICYRCQTYARANLFVNCFNMINKMT